MRTRVQPTDATDSPTPGRQAEIDSLGSRRSPLIFCGMCGALNPASNHFCAACGSTLVDAFHGTEGLRVYERPDSASPLVEIVPAGTELDVVEDVETPEDFVRVRLSEGRLGYIRLHEVEALASATGAISPLDAPDINRSARGCVTPGAALTALALLIVLSTFGFYLLNREDVADSGFLALVFCVAVAPLLVLTVGLYVYARNREERFEEERAGG
jgi:hypothetical protein